MRLKTAIKTLVGVAAAFGFAVFMLWVMSGFGNRQSRIKDVTSKGILLLSNGTEPEDLDLIEIIDERLLRRLAHASRS